MIKGRVSEFVNKMKKGREKVDSFANTFAKQWMNYVMTNQMGPGKHTPKDPKSK